MQYKSKKQTCGACLLLATVALIDGMEGDDGRRSDIMTGFDRQERMSCWLSHGT